MNIDKNQVSMFADIKCEMDQIPDNRTHHANKYNEDGRTYDVIMMECLQHFYCTYTHQYHLYDSLMLFEGKDHRDLARESEIKGEVSMKNINLCQETILLAINLAFEAGCWEGQVELEEHYDNEQYCTVVNESMFSRKMTMPQKNTSIGRTVEINLRSQKWRDGVRNSSNEYKQKSINLLMALI